MYITITPQHYANKITSYEKNMKCRVILHSIILVKYYIIKLMSVIYDCFNCTSISFGIMTKLEEKIIWSIIFYQTHYTEVSSEVAPLVILITCLIEDGRWFS